MKQQKKSPSRSKATSRNYFNPYENKTKTQTRPTYKSYPVTQNELKTNRKKEAEKKGKTTQVVKKSQKAVPKNNNHTKKKSSAKKSTTVSNKKQENIVNVAAMTPEQRRAQMRQNMKLSQEQRVKMKKRRRSRTVLKIAMTMCLTIVLVYGGISLKEHLIKPTVSTQIVEIGTLDTSTQLEGVILRNEKVVYSEESGHVRYVVAEGEKVNKGGLVYLLVDESNLKATTTAKEDVESKIYNQAEKDEPLSHYQDERYNLDQEVKGRMEEFYNNRYVSSTNYIYSLRSQLESSIASRSNLYVKEQETKNQELVALKEQIDTDLGNYQKGKASKESGFISYQMDGYETEDAGVTIKSMTNAEYQKLKKASSPSLLGQGEIGEGAPIYKVILNNDWYLVSFVEAKEAEELAVGQEYTIHFDDLGAPSINFTLEAKEEREKRVQLVFKTNNQIGNFLDVRTVNFSIGEKATSGLKIPTQAIVEQQLIKIPTVYCFEEGDETVVYRQKGEVTETIILDVQYTQNDMKYIRQDLTNVGSVQINDVLVNKESGATYQVSEVETKQGVFVVNNKVAKFREIEILVQNEEATIVKYTNKGQLKEMDKIISNPKSIKVNQLLDEMKVQNE